MNPSKGLNLLNRMIKPLVGNISKTLPQSEKTLEISEIIVHDDCEAYIKEAQSLQKNLCSDFLKKRINDNKMHHMEIFSESSSKHLFFIDSSKVNEDSAFLENSLKDLTNGKAKSIINSLKSLNQKNLNLNLKTSDKNLVISLLNQINYNNFKFDLKFNEEKKESDEFGNKLLVENISLTSDVVEPEILNEMKIINESATLTRNLVNLRADKCTPTFFCENVKAFAEAHKLEYEIIKGQELLDKGLNMIHAVGRSAETPPALAIVHYKGNPDSPDDQ